MIVGNGSIAKAFKDSKFDHERFVIFVSGVSNSKETDDNAFRREAKLLLDIIDLNPDKKLIYFTSILSPSMSNDYYTHKTEMEKLIAARTKDYIIYRIPQVIGHGGNKNNLVHSLRDNIVSGNKFVIYKGILRAILDADDLVSIVDYSKDKINRDYVNISYIEKVFIQDLVGMISIIDNAFPSYTIRQGEGELKNWYLENSIVTIEWILTNNIQIKGYTEKVLRKYL